MLNLGKKFPVKQVKDLILLGMDIERNQPNFH